MANDRYPALMFVVKNGHALAIICGLLALFVVSGGVPVDTATAVWGIAGIGAGALAYLLMRGLQDLLRLIADRMIEP